jgi:DNA-binding MarR family transcriptional regulator
MPNVDSINKNIGNKLHKTVFLLDKISDQILKQKLNLSFSQFLAMQVLFHQPKAPQKFVANSLDQTQAAVSRQVELLVGKKMVSRSRHPARKREYVLSLTKQGLKAFKQGQAVIESGLGKTFEILNKTSKEDLIESLDKLIGAVRQHNKKQ